MLPIGRTTSTWSECGCLAIVGESRGFHVQRCPVRFKRRQRVRRLIKLVVMGIAGGLIAAWLAACSYGTIKANGDLEGFACLSGRVERCHTLPTPTGAPTPGVTPGPVEVCDRIVGGEMPVSGWAMIVSVVSAITALLTTNPFW